MTDFDYGEFMTVTGEIERYLGYLKANETVAEFFFAHQRHVESSGVEMAWSAPIDYQTPAADGFSVDFGMWHWIVYIHEFGSAERGPWADQLRSGAATSWDNGCSWSDGIGGYLRDLCADITRPDASYLQASVQQFSEARLALEGVLPVDWTDLDFNSWSGASSDAAQDVVTELHSVLRDQYLTYFAHAETIFAGVCALVVQTQAGLLPMLQGVRDNLREQLEAWAAEGRQPSDYGGLNALVPDIAGIASQVVDLIPGVGEVKGKLESVAGITGDLLGLFGVEPKLTPREPFDAQTAEQVYDGMCTMLQDDYLRPFEQASQRIKSERSTPVHAAQNGINPWFVDTLDGMDNEPWQHDAEG